MSLTNTISKPSFGVFMPEAYGAVADGTTDDGPAITACFSAAHAVSKYMPVTVAFSTAKVYRVKTTILVTGDVGVQGNGATLLGPITGYAPISSGNNPAVPASSDVIGQSAGGCFSDAANPGSALYNMTFQNMRVSGFRYGFVTKSTWAYTVWKDVAFSDGNIGVFCYQGSQEHKLLGCYGTGNNVTYVASATAFTTDNPLKNGDNFMCDGFVYDGTGINRDSGVSNPTLDAWFTAAIIRPSSMSYTQGNLSGVLYPFTDSDSLAVSGRLIYVPQRNGRNTYALNVRHASAENCARGAMLIANPHGLDVASVGGENCFANGPQSMIVLLRWSGVPGSGTLRSIDAQFSTNPANYAIEVRDAPGGYSDFSSLTALDVHGPGYNPADPWNALTNKPWLFTRTPHVTFQYYDQSFTSATLADVASMNFWAPANCELSFRATIYYTTNSTGYNGLFTVNGPTQSLLAYRVEVPTGTTTRTTWESLSSYGQPTTAPSTSTGGSGVAVVEGMIRTTAAGQVKIRAASGSTGEIRVLRGSSLSYLYSAQV